MTLRSQAAAGVRWTVVASTIIAISETLRTVVLARFLDPVDFGLMAMVGVIIGCAQMYMDMGISAALIHRQDSTKDQLSSLYWLNILSGWLLFALVWFGTPLITKFYCEPRLPHLLRTVGAVFLITPICGQFEILLQKELSFNLLSKSSICSSIGQTTVAILLAALGLGVWSMVYGLLAGAAIGVLFLLPIGLARFRPSFHFRRSDLNGYLSFGLYQIGERTAYYLSQRSDQMLIGSLLGAKALGYYSFAFNLAAQPLSRINPILNKVAFPVFSKVQDDGAKLKRGYMKLVGMLTTVNAPLLIGLAVVAPWAVPTIFGSKWSETIILVQILSFVTLLRSVNNPAGSLLYATGRVSRSFLWHILILVLMVPTVYISCRVGNVTNVAVSLLLLQIFLAVPLYLAMIRPCLGRCAGDYARAILKPTAVAAIMGVVVLMFSRISDSLPIKTEFLVQLLLGALVYSILLRVVHREVFVDIKSALVR
jgi:O-antigen/teichoic acid export membrane protein